MNNFNSISLQDLNENPFSLFKNDWALVTAGTKESYNTMTVSWGGVGVLWNKDVATIYIRPQRYTREFIDNNDFFTISILPDSYKEALTLCGRVSGRDHDKIKESGLTPVFSDTGITFLQARLVFVCKKLYCSEIDPNSFIDETVEKNYPLKDYHKVYISEIVSVYKK